jgi:hypothetical protein
VVVPAGKKGPSSATRNKPPAQAHREHLEVLADEIRRNSAVGG